MLTVEEIAYLINKGQKDLAVELIVSIIEKEKHQQYIRGWNDCELSLFREKEIKLQKETLF